VATSPSGGSQVSDSNINEPKSPNPLTSWEATIGLLNNILTVVTFLPVAFSLIMVTIPALRSSTLTLWIGMATLLGLVTSLPLSWWLLRKTTFSKLSLVLAWLFGIGIGTTFVYYFLVAFQDSTFIPDSGYTSAQQDTLRHIRDWLLQHSFFYNLVTSLSAFILAASLVTMLWCWFTWKRLTKKT
jgi:hypothetical protein